MENYNIDDLIQSLRRFYDAMKAEKSELNNKIRTLSNAVSRKDRKEKEYNSYQAKAAMTKKSTIAFSKDAYVDITRSAYWIDRNLSEYKTQIESLSLRVDILENSGELTKAQRSAVNLFKQFSNEVSQYINNNISELKNWKYDSLKSFVEYEDPNLFNDNTILLYDRLNANFGTPFQTMLKMAGEWKSLREQSINEMQKFESFLQSLVNDRSLREEKSAIVENLLNDAQKELVRTSEALEDSIKSEKELSIKEQATKAALDSLDKTSETYEDDYANLMADLKKIKEFSEEVRVNIAKLQGAKKELQVKLEKLQEEKDALQRSISDIQEKIEVVAKDSNESRQNYDQLISSKYNKVYNMYYDYLNNRGSFIGKNQDDWYKTFGDLLNYELTAFGFRTIADSFNPAYELTDITRRSMDDRRNTTNEKLKYSTFNVPNQELLCVDSIKGSPMSFNFSNWKQSNSIILSQDFSDVTDYFNLLKDISRVKLSIERLSNLEYRGQLSLLSEKQKEYNKIVSEIDQNIERVTSETDNYKELLHKQYTTLEELDKEDPNYLSNWEDIQNQISESKSYLQRLGEELKSLESDKEKVSLLYAGLSIEIENIGVKIAAVDDEQRQLASEMRSLEDKAVNLMNNLFNPDGGAIVNRFWSEGQLYYYDGYSSSIGDNLFKDEITTNFKSKIMTNWNEFVSSDFGHLMELINGNIDDAERIVSLATEFIICLSTK